MINLYADVCRFVLCCFLFVCLFVCFLCGWKEHCIFLLYSQACVQSDMSAMNYRTADEESQIGGENLAIELGVLCTKIRLKIMHVLAYVLRM